MLLRGAIFNRGPRTETQDWAPSGLLQGFVNEVLSGPFLVGHDGHVHPRDSRPTPISLTARISGPPGCLGREPPHRIEVTPQLTVDSTRSVEWATLRFLRSSLILRLSD